ncbi:MAG TPA: glycosyl transferase family 2, partial [Vicinamibacteria bacterium]|nr:glycosyl transferase family 2 [Vicinamibacteria bacterium]
GVEVLGCRVEATAGPGARPGPGMVRYVEWSNALLAHEAIARERFVESPLVHPSVAMRTATLRRLGGWRELDGPEDYELFLRALSAGLRFAKLDEVLLEWRDTPQRLTRRDPRYRPSRFLSVKLEALAELLRGRAVVVWGAGPIGKSWAAALAARGHRLQALVEVDPRKIGQRIRGVPVVPLEQAASLKGAVHLGAVGQPGARERLRAAAAAAGLVDGETFFAVA